MDKDGSASSSLTSLSGGFKSLASNIRATGTVLAATAIPFGIAAIGAAGGAIPAVAASLAGLALNLGQAAAGFTLVGAAAGGGALVGLRAYSALISRVASDTRKAYEATHADAVAQLTDRRNRILNTKAAEAFNEELNRQVINLTKLEAAVGNRVFPIFTREMQAWTPILREMTPLIARTAEDIAGIAAGFARWFRTADDGRLLQQVVGFISDSARKAAAFLAAAGQAGLMAFRPLIPLASRFQSQLVGLVRETDRWVSSAEGQRRLAGIYRSLWNEARRLGPVLLDLGRGLINIFDALDRTGVADQASRGLATIASGFARITRRGTESRQALNRFLNDAKGLMPVVGRATLRLVSAIGGIAGAAIRARQEGHRLTILQEIFRGIGRAARPLRNLVVGTFEDLGPEIAKLIPRLSRFFSVFAGSSGPLVAFVRVINRALQIFNNLPDPIKRTAANLVALKLILGGLGVGAVVGPMGRFASNMFIANRAASKLAGKSALAGVAGSLARIGLLLAGGIGLAALAGSLYVAYKNSNQFRESVDRIGGAAKRAFDKVSHEVTQNLLPTLKRLANKGANAILDIFDLDAQRVKGLGRKAGQRFVEANTATIRASAKRQSGEGTAGYEFGFNVGLAINKGINRGMSGRLAGGRGGGGADNPIGNWLRKHIPGLGWIDDNIADPFVGDVFTGLGHAFGRAKWSKKVAAWLQNPLGAAVRAAGFGNIGEMIARQILAGFFGEPLARRITDHMKSVANNAAKSKAGWGQLGRDAAWGILGGFAEVHLGEEMAKRIAQALGIVKKDNDGNSPWGSTRKLGRDAGEGFVQGLLSSGDAVERATQALANRSLSIMKRVKLGDFLESRNAFPLRPLANIKGKPVKEWDMGSAADMLGTILNSKASSVGKNWAKYFVYHLNKMPDKWRFSHRKDIERLAPRLRQLGYSGFEDLTFIRNQRMRRYQQGGPGPGGSGGGGHRGSWQRGASSGGMTADEHRSNLRGHTRELAGLMIAAMKDAPNLRAFQRSLDKVQGGYFHFRNGMNPEPQ